MSQDLHPDIERLVLSEEEIATIVRDMGAKITHDYADKKLTLVAVLKGATPFMADLMRKIDLPLSIDFMEVYSYGSGTTSSGVVRILKDLNTNIEEKDIVLVEDLLDTGNTLAYLKKILSKRNPASLEIATFLNKEVPNRAKDVQPKYIGADAPNEFLVGYGFDYDELYRNLPYVGILKKSCYE